MKKLKITVLGKTYEVLVEDMGEVSSEAPVYAEHKAPPSVPVAPVERNTEVRVSAPLGSVVVDVAVAVGTKVLAGDPLLTLEAMKMQNVIPSPKDGTVREILVRKGDSVSSGDILVVID